MYFKYFITLILLAIESRIMYSAKQDPNLAQNSSDHLRSIDPRNDDV
jgi:hypothetical protein